MSLSLLDGLDVQHGSNGTMQDNAYMQSLLKHDAQADALFMSELALVSGTPVFLHPKANRFIYLDTCCIGYELQYKRRRSLGVYVSAQGVSVSVPKWVSKQEIECFLHEKSAWLLKKLREQKDKYLQQKALCICWEDGGELFYLGQKVKLCIQSQERDAVWLSQAEQGQVLNVAIKQSSGPVGQDVAKDVAQQLRERVEDWFKAQALAFFKERSASYAEKMGVNPQRIALTSATTRWGSANAKGVIRLHWRLMELPVALIDYVVVHELAHLEEMNHSQRFWALVEHELADYRQLRQQLKNVLLRNW